MPVSTTSVPRAHFPSTSTLSSLRLIPLVVITLACIEGRAAAQTWTGDVPRSIAPNVWSAPDAGQLCSGAVTTRAFNTFAFTVATAGTYGFTATRAGATGVALHLYQNSFSPSFTCVNSLGAGSVSTTGSATLSQTLSAGTYVLVISGANAGDTVGVTLTASGPGALVADCAASTLTPNSIPSAPATGTTVNVVYDPAFGCNSFTTAGVPAWVSGVPSSGSGVTGMNVVVAANSGSARSATITIGTQSLFISQLPPSCSYALNPTSLSVPATGAIESVMVNTAPGCAWSTSSSVGWLTALTPTSGTGSANVTFTSQLNTGPLRTGTIGIGGQTLTVTQANGCTTTVTPASTTAAAGGAVNVQVSVDVSNQACPWTVSNVSAGVSGFGATSGTGDITLEFDVAANAGSARTLSFQVNGQTVTIDQAGNCSFVLNVPTASFSASAAQGIVTVTASGPSCAFAASSASSFLSNVTPSTGSGSVDVVFDIAANPGPARSGTLTVAGQVVTISQASGCTYGLSASFVPVGSSGASGATIGVSTVAGCPWTAQSNSAFLTAVMPASGTGPGTVSFGVAANTNPARMGTLSIAGQTVTVSQSDGCAYSLSTGSLDVPASGVTSASVQLATGPMCPFSVSSPATVVVNVAPVSGTGPATIVFDVVPNSGPARSREVFVQGQRLAIEQEDGCTYTLLLGTSSVGPAMGAVSLQVDASDPACTFDLASSESFASLTVTGASGDQSYSVPIDANSGASREATFTLTAPNGFAASASLVQAAVGAPTLVEHPASVVVDEGSEFTLSVTVSGVVTSYQWRKDGLDIPFATSSSLVVATATASDEGLYTVVVTNGAGSVTSEPAEVTVRRIMLDAGVDDAGIDAAHDDAGPRDAGSGVDMGMGSTGGGCVVAGPRTADKTALLGVPVLVGLARVARRRRRGRRSEAVG